MKFRFIFNPISGRNRRRPGFAQHLRDFIAHRAIDADLTITEGPGHATELARDAVRAGARVVVAIGGDGTMNEVAQALVGTPAALALVPCGSGNGLALHLGLPRAAIDALDLATCASGRIAAIDTGVADGRPFFNAMGLTLKAGRWFDANRPMDDMTLPYPEDKAVEKAVAERGVNVVLNEYAVKKLGFKSPQDAVG